MAADAGVQAPNRQASAVSSRRSAGVIPMATVLAVVVPLAWWVLRRFVREAGDTHKQVGKEAISATQAAPEHDAQAAAAHTEQAVLKAVAENEKALAEKIGGLEAALASERSIRETLQVALETETHERKEAFLWQEHRVLTAV